MFPAVGYMPMPAGFAHADIFMRGRPSHGLAGKAQTLSVFRYHEEGQDPDVEVVIDKFIGDFQKARTLNESGLAPNPV